MRLPIILSLYAYLMLSLNSIHGQKMSLKVITIAMYEEGEMKGDEAGEAQLWYERDSMFLEMHIPGAFSSLFYNKKGQGLIITGAGAENASSTIMALGLNNNLDLKNTYFIIAGIAGTSPKVCTIGSAIWTEWVINADMCCEIDTREMPSNWKFSRFRLGCNEPWCSEGWTAGTEVFRLDSALTKKAYYLTKNVTLLDSPDAQNIRNRFPENSAARMKPFITLGDNIAGSTYLYGKNLSEWAEWWVKKWTNDKGTYYVANMDDSGTLTAFARLSGAKIISYNRILLLRTASDFDQQPPGKSGKESIDYIAIENAYRVGSVVAHDIINNWTTWNEH
jgi:purine nucleoside permease